MPTEQSNHRKRTKIVCTIGPSCSDLKTLENMEKCGMNIARLNLSHGTHASHSETADLVRKLQNVPILFDTKGPEIRTGERAEPLAVTDGMEVVFVPEGIEASGNVIEVNYDRFASDVKETKQILVDNGALIFDILSSNEDGSVNAKALQSGSIGSRRHVNLPGADVDLPSITDKDWEDIAFSVEQNADFLALSFIRNRDDIDRVRSFIEEKGGDIQLIAKIETEKAVENIAEIVDASDGIMVARGDLGAEIPFEDVFQVQNEITVRCRDAGIPVIIATQMLASMREHPVPTRAEVTDIAHAVETGADATMLSGETASGKHPIESIDAMRRIIEETEMNQDRFLESKPTGVHDALEAQAEAAVGLVQSGDVDAMFVFTRTGTTARLVSKFRPHVPIITIAASQKTRNVVQLLYGTYPIVIEFNDPEQTVQSALDEAKKSGLLSTGDSVVMISDTDAKEAPVSSVQVRDV